MGDLFRLYNNFYWRIIDSFSFKIEKIGIFYEKIIGREYLKESKFFNISESQRILHIGCGSYPLTAFILAKNFGKDIVAIDKNPKAVNNSKKIVNKKNIENRITIKNADGSKYSVENFDTIIISGCSYPFEKVLYNVCKTAKPESKIIVRVFLDETNKIQNMLDYFENIYFKSSKTNSSFPCFKWESYLLFKK